MGQEMTDSREFLTCSVELRLTLFRFYFFFFFFSDNVRERAFLTTFVEAQERVEFL